MKVASNAGISRNFPTLKYLAAPFRWLFGSRRRALTTAAVLVAMIAAPSLWWAAQLTGLPDIGDPFDVEAFRSFTIPDDRNAFVLYRQAADRLKPLIASSKAQEQAIKLHVPWSQADPAVHRWVEDNREAMALFRQGTERPDARDPDLPSDPDSRKTGPALRSFHELALLEASRLEEQGDMAGAWTWYRAALRATDHVSLRGTVFMRIRAAGRNGLIRRRVSTWAADPRTTPALIRRALDDVVACGVFTPSDPYTIKVGYPWDEIELDSPDNPGRQLLFLRLNANLGSLAYQLDSDQVRALADAWRFWRREPERGRRVMRLAIANWLAYYDLPPDRRPQPDPEVSGPFEFYAFGPDAPANARALSPGALDRWLKTSVRRAGNAP